MRNFNFYFCFSAIIFIFCQLFLNSCRQLDNNNTVQKPYVIMLSLDGFRWDYPDSIFTPNLDYLAKNGVKARSLKPCFPTKTFPNHYSIATGLYPDNHGIVMNSFYDKEMDKYYFIRNREAVEDPHFYDGEPIWVTAEKQGVISASFFWVGSEASIQGIRPKYWKRYEHNFPFEARIDTVIKWLQLPEEIRPHLILWYMHEPDNIGHDDGPCGEKTLNTVIYLDSLVGVFLNKLKELPVYNNVNFIVTSDHGMCATSDDRVVILSDHVDPEWFEIIQGYNPNFNVKVKEGFLDTASIVLSNINHIKAWKHGEVPEHLNYGNHPRTLDIIIVADSGWTVAWQERKSYGKGAHGYENTNTDMHAIFYAIGPAFKKGEACPTFDNIDIYPLIAHILRLKPAEVDGKLENVEGILAK